MTITHEPQTDQDLGVRVKTVADAAYQIRMGVLEQGEAQGEGYVGQALGAADLFAAVYADQLRYRPAEPDWADRDRFLLSIGHYALGLYATLAEAGVIPREELATYASDGSRLPMSAMSSYTPGVEISGGSLGHGLGLGVGMALGLRQQGRTDQKVFVMFSDGELDEGSVWEAALFGGHHGLSNLVAVVDYNKIQSLASVDETLRLEPFAAKWRAFGWQVQEVPGHDLGALKVVLNVRPSDGVEPTVVIAHTTKGKGVSFMENSVLWHYRTPQGEE